MSISTSPSKLSLPQQNPGVSTVLEYLIFKFPNIAASVWEQRVLEGKVHWHGGKLIDASTAFVPQQRVYYYREVEEEPVIPFAESIVYQDELILVADKPHFLPVTPGGGHVRECLQVRLREKIDNPHLQALHRIDRATAGLVVFSADPKFRKQYHNLFENRQITKTYLAVARCSEKQPKIDQQWSVRNRIEKVGERFLMGVTEGPANSHSHIRCLQCVDGKALFELMPVTGRTHQLRLHMQYLGWPIMNDTYYPEMLRPSEHADYSRPLQLLAQQLRFTDPITKQARSFVSANELEFARFEQ